MIYIVGFLAQFFFSARILIQWLMSERARKIVSPTIFWALSLAGSYLLFIYGWLRNDFSILLGQFLSYYIYIWNLKIKGQWIKIPLFFRILLFITPVIALFLVGINIEHFVQQFLNHDDIPLWLVCLGSIGQIIFTLRFIYQWYYSYKRQESFLPIGFWLISIIGASIIVFYAIIRLDPVLIIGQGFGLVTYTRNLFLGKKIIKEDS